MQINAVTWNLFHGRDAPPDRALLTARSRLLRISERNATHIQVNRNLLDEFAAVLAGAEWDLALLQECPPRWCEPLAGACGAKPHRVLTSRNSLSAIRALGARLNPDLIASNEGGSNLTLVRGGEIVERRALELRPGPRPERRTMAFTRIALAGGADLCVVNLHASGVATNRALAEQEVLTAAERAAAWSGAAPLLVGGDLNLRPRASGVYAELERRYDLRAPTAPDSLDHLLARGLVTVRASAAWSPKRREVPAEGLAIRLSDHAPVDAAFALG